AQSVDRSLHLPPGWNDEYFERLDEGVTPRTVVAVMDFSGGELLQSHLQFSMSDMLITALVRAGRFTVVERDRLDMVMEELTLQESDRIDPATAAEVGRLLGAELVVFGMVTSATEQLVDKFAYDEVQVEVAVDIRAVSTTDGRVVISESAQGLDDARIITTADGRIVSGPTDYDPLYVRATAAALDQVSDLVSNTAPLIGFVISVNDRSAVIDLGAGRGVQLNDRFIVFRRGQELRHPVTRERIGWQKTVLAVLEVRVVEASLSTGEIVVVADRDFAIVPGDLVIFERAGDH
ncbi:MAG: CsgG/HfaB family protein, partial [Gemmatimonadales bacterium]